MGEYTPQSRSEEILYDTIHSLEYTERPQSRIEELLLELKAVIEGSSGTTDYEELTHKPSINNVELSGDKSLSDLGIASTVDSVTDGDMNPVTSNAVYDSISIRPRVKRHGITIPSVTAGTSVSLGSIYDLTDGAVSYYAHLFGVVKNSIAGTASYDANGSLYATQSNTIEYVPKVTQNNVFISFSILY